METQIRSNKRRTVVLVAGFLAVWVAVGVVLGLVLAAPGQVLADAVGGAAVFAVLAVAGAVFSLTAGPRLVLTVAGAHPAEGRQYRRLHDMVDALAIGKGITPPQVYVVDDPSPNAFATGVGPRRAAVTVTTGLLALMDREELEGVLAHEMSHIRNYDVRLLLVVSTLIGMAGLLASVVWRTVIVVRPRGRDAEEVFAAVALAGLLLAAVAVVVGPLIRLALSRRREELADVSAVELTRNPAGLIGALRKLEHNDRPMEHVNHATAAMCIDDPLQHHEGWLHRLFDTHPPISERIAVLEGILEAHTV